MSTDPFHAPDPFLSKARKGDVPLILITESGFNAWLKKAPQKIKTLAEQEGFSKSGKPVLISRSAKGEPEKVYARLDTDTPRYGMAAIADVILKAFTTKALKSLSFTLETKNLKDSALTQALIGWGLAHYRFERYKSGDGKTASLVWPKSADKKAIKAHVEAISLTRNMINTPANDMGPDAIEDIARKLAKSHEAKISVITGDKLLEKNFPLIHVVGRANDRPPRLIDIKWGNAKNPLVTLVGKGVAFDTGGLNLKPGGAMALMKKDMGGAAHVLGLAHLIMAAKLPVRLRVLVPAVENSISDNAFRPGDVYPSRKGLTVENTNTDAEGRLILADALTYATEDKKALPDLVVDYATLTGSARAGLGHDIPGLFSSDPKIGKTLQDLSFDHEDPVWMMPLHTPYKKHLDSSIADCVNSASVPGDLIYSALFLHQFVENKANWLHLDCFAWESSGKAGRPKGGADTGMLSVFELIKQRYS